MRANAKLRLPLEQARGVVCMISHSKVNRDARVARTAEALLRNGFQLHLICLANEREPEMPEGLERAGFHQIRDYRDVDGRTKRQKEPSADSGQRVRKIRAGSGSLAARCRLALLRLSGVRYPLFYLQSLSCAFRIKPDIVHCHDLNVLPVGFLVSRLSRSRLIYDSHEIFTEKVGLRARWFWKGLERLFASRCQSIITTTEARARILQEQHPAVTRPAVIHNYPVPYDGPAEDVRQLAGLPAGAFVALYQGGVQPHRGLETIIESARFAKEVFFVIQGDGPLYSKIVERVKQRCLDNVRVLPGAVYAEMRKFTASADVGLQVLTGVSLNHTSTLSNKLFEYIHAGLPVIASDFPMIREYVMKYGFGLLVDPEEPEQIARAARRLQTDPAERRRLAQKALEASKILSWDHESRHLIRLYEEIGASDPWSTP